MLPSCALFLPAVMAAVLDQIARSLAAPDDRRRLLALATLVAVIQNGLDMSSSESVTAVTQQAASLTSMDALRVRSLFSEDQHCRTSAYSSTFHRIDSKLNTEW